MVVVGIDAHKGTHTAVAVDEAGRKLGHKTTSSTTSEANLELLRWADALAHLDGPSRDLRLLVEHREDLVGERTSQVNRLRWHLHELDPAWDPAPRSLVRFKHLDALAARLDGMGGTLAWVASDLVGRIRELTLATNELKRRIEEQVRVLAPALLGVAGVGTLTAAKIVAEVAGVGRFRSKDAFARHNGTAPLPVWPGNTVRHRLSRTGNRQLNAAVHRIAVTQMRMHEPARSYPERRIAMGNTKTEALRALKRRLSDVAFRALLADADAAASLDTGRAA
jgi:transposase